VILNVNHYRFTVWSSFLCTFPLCKSLSRVFLRLVVVFDVGCRFDSAFFFHHHCSALNRYKHSYANYGSSLHTHRSYAFPARRYVHIFIVFAFEAVVTLRAVYSSCDPIGIKPMTTRLPAIEPVTSSRVPWVVHFMRFHSTRPRPRPWSFGPLASDITCLLEFRTLHLWLFFSYHHRRRGF
jgi:hypothetical protein